MLFPVPSCLLYPWNIDWVDFKDLLLAVIFDPRVRFHILHRASTVNLSHTQLFYFVNQMLLLLFSDIGQVLIVDVG